MKIRSLAAAFLVPAFLVGCAGNPTAPTHHDDTADLVVDLALSSSHVHILSELTFTVTVTNDHGELVTDFDTLRVERRASDSDTWRGLDLALQGTAYVGTYTFTSSGDYEIRVAGRRGEDVAMVTMYTMPEMMSAARAHAEAGGYRIEFESFPGHLHQHQPATMKFWVMEAEADPTTGVRAPVTGLATELHCTESDGMSEEHVMTESEPGVYEAAHTFMSVGHFLAEMHLTGLDGLAAEASFETHVAAAH